MARRVGAKPAINATSKRTADDARAFVSRFDELTRAGKH